MLKRCKDRKKNDNSVKLAQQKNILGKKSSCGTCFAILLTITHHNTNKQINKK